MPIYVPSEIFLSIGPYELYRACLSHPLLESFVTRSPIWFNLENNYQGTFEQILRGRYSEVPKQRIIPSDIAGLPF